MTPSSVLELLQRQMPEHFEIPILLQEEEGISRTREPVRIGVPFPKGLTTDPAELCLRNPDGEMRLFQTKILETWSDSSLKWLLVDFFVELTANSSSVYTLQPLAETTPPGGQIIHTKLTSESLTVDNGTFSCCAGRGSQAPPLSLTLDKNGPTVDVHLLFTGSKGRQIPFTIEESRITDSGPLRCSILQKGFVPSEKGERLLNVSLLHHLFAGSSVAAVDVTLHNPRAAKHYGGLWDLGDPGSVFFKECALQATMPDAPRRLVWQTSPDAEIQRKETGNWHLYQDSSGGSNWDSPNHVDSSNDLTVSFSGYRLNYHYDGRQERKEGKRATPYLLADCGNSFFGGASLDFWQNFPKSLSIEGAKLTIGLFPAECRKSFELQPGEQKRHTIFLQFCPPEASNVLPQFILPLNVAVDPQWVARSKAVSYFSPANQADNVLYRDYLRNIIEGEHSFFNKREIIDEFGWRNFGDLYADHEAVQHTGKEPFISHYNNQYDFVYGACLHHLRTGDRRWWNLAAPAARHMVDIDIYHTQEDRAAYNGGLFWHSDHYLPAKTASHRAYSRKNKTSSDYGGGTSNEQLYSSGLALYYFLTGDSLAKEAVLELAEFVLQMDDGSKTILALFDEGPSGLASKTVYQDYHKPGRGPGNAINCLIDAYRLSSNRRYLDKAEELVRRCIHPKDDIAALNLNDPEYRWSYLVFLQIIGKYLDYKRELGEYDYPFFYARDSLLHYAEWMVAHELPYQEVLHKVLIPTETWPAQDIRKCHVFHLAAKYGPQEKTAAYMERASFFFERCLKDLLTYQSAYLTRPLVLLCVYGYVQDYFLKDGCKLPLAAHCYDFGSPPDFLPQRLRFKGHFLKKIKTTIHLARLMMIDKIRSRMLGKG